MMFKVGDKVKLGINGVLVWTVERVWPTGMLTIVDVSDSGRRTRYAHPAEVVKDA